MGEKSMTEKNSSKGKKPFSIQHFVCFVVVAIAYHRCVCVCVGDIAWNQWFVLEIRHTDENEPRFRRTKKWVLCLMMTLLQPYSESPDWAVKWLLVMVMRLNAQIATKIANVISELAFVRACASIWCDVLCTAAKNG